MKFEEIMEVVKSFSYSQGFYGRLYKNIMELKECDNNKFLKLKTELENQNFKDGLDIVLYFEC